MPEAMTSSTATLLASRRFAPLFATQFLGAFNDNLFRTAMTFLVVYRLLTHDAAGAGLVATLAAGLFILPYFLFSSLAGQIADVHDKAAVARWVKIAEIVIMAAGVLALHGDSVALLLAVVFLLGVHSAFFGPMKYAILPQHLHGHELLAGTGLVEAGTFLAILFGQIVGGLLPAETAAWAALGVAVLGWATSRAIPPAPPLVTSGRLGWNLAGETWALMRAAHANRPAFAALMGISWFWALGAVMTAQIGPLSKSYLGAAPAVATLCLTTFSVGIAVGSVVVARLLRGRISVRYAAPALVVLALALIDLVFAVRAFAPPPGASGTAAPLLDVATFLARPAAWRVLADLAVLALAGGIYSVPLYAVLQTSGAPETRARMIAANNVMNAVFMVGATLLTSLVLLAGGTLPTLFAVLAGLSLVAAALTRAASRGSAGAAPSGPPAAP